MSEATTIRPTDKDRENIAVIIDGGLAANTSEAIRVSLALVARRLVPNKTHETALRELAEALHRYETARTTRSGETQRLWLDLLATRDEADATLT